MLFIIGSVLLRRSSWFLCFVLLNNLLLFLSYLPFPGSGQGPRFILNVWFCYFYFLGPGQTQNLLMGSHAEACGGGASPPTPCPPTPTHTFTLRLVGGGCTPTPPPSWWGAIAPLPPPHPVYKNPKIPKNSQDCIHD